MGNWHLKEDNGEQKQNNFKLGGSESKKSSDNNRIVEGSTGNGRNRKK